MSENDAPSAAQVLAFVNANLGGYNQATGFAFTAVSSEEARGQLTVSSIHHQPFGIVHGGVYASMVESACSTGAALYARTMGKSIVGLDNQTSFLRAVRTGVLEVIAKPLTRGKRTQLWQADVFNQEGTLVATGRVRLLNLEEGTEVAGQEVKRWA
jgi:1,4-dihydroxy-2-naphthoyl-CoA hydrolase